MPHPPLLVQFGAGNIGRSLMGQLFSAAGWTVLFLDVAAPIIDALNRRHGYEIHIKDELLPGQPPVLRVDKVSGLDLGATEEVIQALVGADMVGTSVGAANLPSACRLLAAAMVRRRRPLPVMLCENIHGGSFLGKKYLAEAFGELPEEKEAAALIGQVHFIEAAISKMVPATPPEVRRENPLTVWAESYATLYLDRDAYPGTPPTIPGVAWRRDFAAYMDRKLFLHNFGHAACAYHGFLAGKNFIYECMEDPAVARETAACMMETARGLAIRYPDVFTFDENRAWADDLLRRFHNRALADPVFRVGRDLKRKLAPDDRCLGALRMLLATGVEPTHTLRAIAAGLHFLPRGEEGYFPGDKEIVDAAASRGPEWVLTGLCRLDPEKDRESIQAITREYREMKE